MNVNQVKTAVKVGTFKALKSGPNLITIDYLLNNKDLLDESPRIYLITSDGVIKKIGGSRAKTDANLTMLAPILAAMESAMKQ